MTTHITPSLEELARHELASFRGLSQEECEQLAHDVRTGLRAIGIYNDLLLRDIQSRQESQDLQIYCDGINTTVEEVSTRLERLRS